MDIKAIVMDIDGTLIVKDKGILPRTKEALLKAQAQGIRLILASGRPTTGMVEFGEELKMDKNGGLLISYNGAKVIDMQTMEEIYDVTMAIEDSKDVLEHMKKFDIHPMIDKGEYMYVNDAFGVIELEGKAVNIVQYESRNEKYLVCEKADLADFVDYPLNKILTAGSPEYLQENYVAMMEPFKDRLNCMFTSSFYFEFTAKGVDKAKALEKILESTNIDASEVISFGDGHNDISLLQYAGIGIAMENAVEELKNIADEVTLSNENDGIAESLSKLCF